MSVRPIIAIEYLCGSAASRNPVASCGNFPDLERSKSIDTELSMGPFSLTQPDPPHSRPDPTRLTGPDPTQTGLNDDVFKLIYRSI
jgi:hypothetical protein